MSVTVVGGAGFVGRRLVARLSELGRAPWVPAKGDPGLLSRDLGVVFYCAGLTADYDRRPFETVEAHAALLSRLIEAGRFERLVYLSSTRLYDGLPDAEVDEARPLSFDVADPRRVYDLSKALGENLTLARSGGRGAVARLANVYDWTPGARGFLSEWLVRAGTERDIELASSPHLARDYIHLDEVVAALLAIADGPAEVYNVASGELTRNGELAEVFEQAGWRIRLTGDARPAPPPNVATGRLRALGLSPRPVREVVGRYLQELKA